MLHRLLIVLAAVGIAVAQDPPSRAGRISYVSGAVSFQPAGVTDWTAATVNRPLTIGDQLFADAGARAEVHIPGTAFWLGDRTAFQFMNLDDRNAQIRLSEGSLDIRVRNLYGNIEIDTPNLAFTVSQPGDYRLDTDANGNQTLVTDRSGAGQVIGAGGSFNLAAGQQAVVQGQGQAAQYQVNAAPGYDGFDNWVNTRIAREDRYARSPYVSQEMVGYEDLGEYGTWRSTPDYGEVWVPNGVASGWAPYHEGHWAWVEPWGWNWVDDEPWGFAPFHYGRWAHINGYWGWCPGPVAEAPVYAPALVAWVGFGGGAGVSIGVGGGPAVGWFPLGPRDVYIPPFSASAGFVDRINVSNARVINVTNVTNVYNNYTRTHTIPVASYMNRSVPGAVVAVPQNAFATARPVQQVAIRVQPAQIAAIKVVAPAPRVAPQVAAVLGRSPGVRVAAPPAAVLSRAIVAHTAPPPAPASFQQRQALLARNPGRPIPVAQLHQMAVAAKPAAAVRPKVMVQSHPRTITPRVVRAGTPARTPAGMPPQAKPPAPQAAHTAPPAAPNRGFEPPSAQHATAQPPTRPGAPPAAPQHAATQPPSRTPSRGFEPPSAQHATAQPPTRPGAPQHAAAQPQPSRTPNRGFEPPPAQQHATAKPPARPGAPQHAAAQPQPSRTPNRAFEPPQAKQHAVANPHAAPTPARPAPAATQHAATQPQPGRAPNRSFEPPKAQQHAVATPPPARTAPQHATARPTPAPAERTLHAHATPPPTYHAPAPARPQAPRVQAPAPKPAPVTHAQVHQAAPPPRQEAPRAPAPQRAAPPPAHPAAHPAHQPPPEEKEKKKQ